MDLAVFDMVLMPLVAGAVGTFFLFVLLGLGALPFTAALDQSIGKEKALLLYSLLLLVGTFLLYSGSAPDKRKVKPGTVKGMTVEPLDLKGDPFARPAYALVADDTDQTRNVFQRYSDTSPLPPPALDMPPMLALERGLPPTVPGPAPGHRWVLRGDFPTIDPESAAGIAEIPDAEFQDYQIQPEDVFDSLTKAGQTTFVFLSVLNGGEGEVKFGEPGYDELARRLVAEEGNEILMKFAYIGGAKEAARRLDANKDGQVTPNEVAVVQNEARLKVSAERTLTDGESVQLRRSVDNLYNEALRRNGIRPNFREGPKDVSALRRAARDMAKVGATGKDNFEGWRRAADLLEVALAEAKRVGGDAVRSDVLLELLEAYRALHNERAILRVLAEYVRANPKQEDGWTWLGDVTLERMGQASLALDYYDEALSHNRGYALAKLGKGRALSLAGEHTRALASYRDAVGVPRAKYYRALGLLRTGKLDQAKAEVDAYLVNNANDPEAILLRGCVLYAQGKDLGSARAAFERVATMPDASRTRAKACYNLGLTCARMGQKKAALTAFERTYRGA